MWSSPFSDCFLCGSALPALAFCGVTAAFLFVVVPGMRVDTSFVNSSILPRIQSMDSLILLFRSFKALMKNANSSFIIKTIQLLLAESLRTFVKPLMILLSRTSASAATSSSLSPKLNKYLTMLPFDRLRIFFIASCITPGSAFFSVSRIVKPIFLPASPKPGMKPNAISAPSAQCHSSRLLPS